MISPDAILKGFSILSTVIATLRASSRAVYLMNHDAIGIMDGPNNVLMADRDVERVDRIHVLRFLR